MSVFRKSARLVKAAGVCVCVSCRCRVPCVVVESVGRVAAVAAVAAAAPAAAGRLPGLLESGSEG